MKSTGHRLFSKFLDKSLTTKLIWIFLLLIFIPMFTTNLIAYINYKNNIRSNAQGYTYNIIDKMLRDLDESTKETERFSSLLLYTKEFEIDLSLDKNDYQKTRRLSFYIDFLQSAMKSSNSVYILDPKGHAYFNNTFRPHPETKFDRWMALAKASKGKAAFAGTELVTDYFGQQRYLLTTVRALRSRYDLHLLGVMAIESDLTSYAGIIGQLDKLTKGMTTVVDNKGQVILHSGSPGFTQHVLQMDKEKGGLSGKGHFTFRFEGISYLCNFDTSVQTGWTMIVATPLGELLKSATSTRNFTIVVTMLATCLALLVAGIAVTLLTRPLRKMERLMKGVQDGNFHIRYPIRHKDEIGRLGTHFNRMVQRIGELIDEVYVISLRKNKAELELLQSQINPHFLYNTLEMIRMAAEMNRDVQVSHMVFVLGKLLRYGVNRNGDIVTVEQEMEHVRNYLFLYNYRSGQQTSLEVEIGESELRLPIMRLIFQPIVENALLHGQEELRPMRISIRSFDEGGTIRFDIRDNGRGMMPERVEEVRHEIQGIAEAAHPKEHIGIGLKNINDRIQLHYGSRFGLEMKSEFGEGTVVSVRIP